MTMIQAKNTIRAPIQPLPERPMLRGNGGGAPEGLRVRRVRRTVGATRSALSVSATVSWATASGPVSAVTA